MVTEISYKDEARQKMKQGVDKLANAVKVTLGAGGRNVTIRDERTGKPKVTKDGVTVARVINLPDKVEDMGAQLIKAAAEKTAALAGDGTTTSTLLAQVIITEGLKHMDSASANPVNMKRGIDKAVTAVLVSLREQSQTVTLDNIERLVNVATISANNDGEIGKIVADAMKRVGADGVVTLQESKTAETYIERVDGLQIDKGYISPFFVNNLPKMSVDFEDAIILLYDRKISLYMDLEPLLNFAIGNKKPLLIIAEDVEGEALATLIANRTQRAFPFAAIKHPGFGNMSLQMLEDIASLTGGKVVSDSKGDILKNIKFTEYVGRAAKITITNVTTTITGGKGKKDDIADRIQQVKALIDNNPNEIEKEKLRKWRLAKLANGVGVIHVGATTEVEMKEKKDRIDDSLCATKAALEEGILPGGGVSYIRALQAIETLTSEDKDEQIGINIIRKALEEPLMQMLTNAGVQNIEEVINTVKACADADGGYNLKTGAYEAFFTTGIIDPSKVARVALENAASVGAMFLTTECAIVDYQPMQNQK